MGAIRIWQRWVAAAAIVGLLGCGERAPIGPVTESPSHDLVQSAPWLGLPTLLKCSPMPAASETAEIGPDGGVLQVGPHRLTIPAGALDGTVVITAVAPSDTVNRVELGPEGLTFARSISLTLSYANCQGLGLAFPKQIAYTDGQLNILELLPSLDNFFARRVTGQVSHFSDYAIAW